MYTVNACPYPKTVAQFPVLIATQPDPRLEELLANLTPDTPWGERQIAAKK